MDGMNQMSGPISMPMSGINTMRRASLSLRVIKYMVERSMLFSSENFSHKVPMIHKTRSCGRARLVQWKCDEGTLSSKPPRPPICGSASTMTAVQTVIVTIRNACTKSLASTAHEPPANATSVTTAPRTTSIVFMSILNTADMKTPMAFNPTPAKNSNKGSLIQV